MRLQKAVILFFLFASFAISQNREITITSLKIDPRPCTECEISVNGKPTGFSDISGRFHLYYDSTRSEKFQIEVTDASEKISKRFTITLGKDQKNPESVLIYLNQLGAYLTIDESNDNISEMLQYFKEAGVTDVFVPVFANGKTLYPSKVEGVMSSNRDYLKEVIAECEKLKIRVYATINTLNWGIGNAKNQKFTDYLMVNKNGEYNKGEEGKYSFVSPANPEVIRILTEISRELAVNYRNLYGINLDYLRFKKGSYKKLDEEDFGFEKNSVDLFKSSYKLDPYKIKFDTTKGSPWLKWIEFRENLITNLFVKMAASAKDTNSNLKLTMNLSPSYLTERGLELTCANAYDIEQFVYPDHYLLEVSKKDVANEMRMIDQYMPSDNPFEEKGVIARRRAAFIPLIRNESPITPEEFDQMLEILSKKGKGADFSVYDESIFKNTKNRKKFLEIISN
jgi:hypothetical protein